MAITESKDKKETRRLKQRADNILRAQKMHAARLLHEKSFKPKLKHTKPGKSPRFFIGLSGWFYWHWKNIFYPSNISTTEWFSYYASNFKTVELNAPFYSWPTLATVSSWIKQAKKKKFIYSVKVSELITHIKKFNGTKHLIKDFSLIADILGPYMGCFLFQLPPSYHYTKTRLKNILSQLDHSRKNVIEFRHASWWNTDVFEAFKKTGTIFCSTSAPRLPDTLIKTAEDIYIRFHGANKWYQHDYDNNELEIWAERIKQSHAKTVWVYFNNDKNAYAVKNAKNLNRLLKKQR